MENCCSHLSCVLRISENVFKTWYVICSTMLKLCVCVRKTTQDYDKINIFHYMTKSRATHVRKHTHVVYLRAGLPRVICAMRSVYQAEPKRTLHGTEHKVFTGCWWKSASGVIYECMVYARRPSCRSQSTFYREPSLLPNWCPADRKPHSDIPPTHHAQTHMNVSWCCSK